MLRESKKPSSKKKAGGCCKCSACRGCLKKTGNCLKKTGWSVLSSWPVVYGTALFIGGMSFITTLWGGPFAVNKIREICWGWAELESTHWSTYLFFSVGVLAAAINSGYAAYRIRTNITESNSSKDKFSHIDFVLAVNEEEINTLQEKNRFLHTRFREITGTLQKFAKMFQFVMPKPGVSQPGKPQDPKMKELYDFHEQLKMISVLGLSPEQPSPEQHFLKPSPNGDLGDEKKQGLSDQAINFRLSTVHNARKHRVQHPTLPRSSRSNSFDSIENLSTQGKYKKFSAESPLRQPLIDNGISLSPRN